MSDADVYEEETPDESIDEVHNPDGTLKESVQSVPGTVARMDPMDELLGTDEPVENHDIEEKPHTSPTDVEVADGTTSSSDDT